MRDLILPMARAELGVTEWPADSNRVKYNTWYYGSAVSGASYPWCMAFVQWVYDAAAETLPYKTASCSALLERYKKTDPTCIVRDPQPGDIVIYTFGHCGIVESSSSGYITAIEGNTGFDNDANGGAVLRRTRERRLCQAFIRPREKTPWSAKNEVTEDAVEKRYNTLADLPAWSRPVIARMVDAGLITGRGEKQDADGKPADLDLSEDMVRLLVILTRAGKI